MMRPLALVSALLAPSALAITLDLSSSDSIKTAAKSVATRMLTYYNGGTPGQIITGIPGTLPQGPVKYYWWECGEMFLSLIDYWYYTNDSSWNNLVTEGMMFQTGPLNNYMPPNQTKDLGNDDQVFWAFAAMAAAEYNFPNPSADQPSWLSLAMAVFNVQMERWDTSSCGGGLRWQIYPFNSGYDYKNSASNMGLFNLASRLYYYTGNVTYANYANQIWDWQASINLVSPKGEVFDGSDDLKNCTELDHVQWTYTAGMAIHGAAAMYAGTNQSSKWGDRINSVWQMSASTFFPKDKIMSETACEANNPVNCNIDQLSFKSSFARFIAASTKLAPWLSDQVMPYLSASAQAAAAQCTGQPGGDSCGTLWNTGSWDGSTGLGQEMSALQVIQANLIQSSRNPVTNSTGGTSIGNPAAGTESTQQPFTYAPLTTGDKAGAGILTALVLVMTISMTWYACH